MRLLCLWAQSNEGKRQIRHLQAARRMGGVDFHDAGGGVGVQRVEAVGGFEPVRRVGGRRRAVPAGAAPRLEVIPVTAPSTQSSHNCITERTVDEAQYVLAVLHQMRDQVSANPESFDPDAQDRIDKAIACTEHVLRYARTQLMTRSGEQRSKLPDTGPWYKDTNVRTQESFRAGRDSTAEVVRHLQAAHHEGAATICPTEKRRRSPHRVLRQTRGSGEPSQLRGEGEAGGDNRVILISCEPIRVTTGSRSCERLQHTINCASRERSF